MTGVERTFERVPDGGGPPDGWQEKVLARIDQPAPVRRRWPLVLASSSLVAAATAGALFFALRTPKTAPAPRTPPAVERTEALFDRLDDAVHGLVQVKEQAFEQLLSARTDAERALAQQALDNARRELERVQRQLMKVRVRLPRVDDAKIVAKCDPNDPLCAIE